MKNKILIITATTGSRQTYLMENIESVQSQTYRNYIHLVVDNTPNAKLKGFIKKLSLNNKRIQYLHLPFMYSPAGSRNAGLYTRQARTADLIKWLDDDDKLYSPYSLAKLVEAFLEDVVMVYGQQEYISGANKKIYIKPEGGLVAEDILVKSSFPCSSMIFKKEFIAQLGGFNWYKSSEDLDLVLRAFGLAEKLNKEIKFIQEVVSCYRKHEGGIGFHNRLNGEKSYINKVLKFKYADNLLHYHYLDMKSRLHHAKKLAKNTLSLNLLGKDDMLLKLNRDFY